MKHRSLMAGAFGLVAAAVMCVAPASPMFPGAALAAAADLNPSVNGPLQGQTLIQALRQGGLILWMRHGARDSRSGDVSDQQAAAHDCVSQSQLTAEGEAQAREVGAALRTVLVPVETVYVARLCRTEASGKLLGVAPVVEDSRLDEATTWTDRGGDEAYRKAIAAFLATRPPAGKNLVAVTSQLTISDPRPKGLADLGPAEIVVLKPSPAEAPEVLARIRPSDWQSLERLRNEKQLPSIRSHRGFPR